MHGGAHGAVEDIFAGLEAKAHHCAHHPAMPWAVELAEGHEHEDYAGGLRNFFRIGTAPRHHGVDPAGANGELHDRPSADKRQGNGYSAAPKESQRGP